MQAQKQMGQPQSQRAGNFFAATRQNVIPGPVFTFPNGLTNLTLTQVLPQTGYGAALNIFMSGTTTTAAASTTTSANTDYPPPPLGYIQRLRIYNTQGLDLFNVTGYGLYLWMIAQRSDFESIVAHTGQFVGGFTPTVFAQYFKAPSTTGASSTDTWQMAFRIMVAWGENLQAGLQLFQDLSVQYFLEITVGSPSSIYGATTGTVTLASTITTEVELFSVPPSPADQPRLNYTQVVLEDLQTSGFAAGADLQYKIIPGNILCQLIHEIAAGSPLAPASSANLTALKLNYSQVQVPYFSKSPFPYFRQRRIYGRDMPPAVLIHELQCPNGIPELKGGRDLLNLAQLTDANSLISLASGFSTTAAQLRTVRTLLAANR
jgi:hypothetical protein